MAKSVKIMLFPWLVFLRKYPCWGKIIFSRKRKSKNAEKRETFCKKKALYIANSQFFMSFLITPI
ncbi:MAG: hypothetical protein ACI85O_000266 [Saprospiraceae bacterium]|jgi:hypothetical protein